MYLLPVLLHVVIRCMEIVSGLVHDPLHSRMHAYFRNSAHQCLVGDVVFPV